MLPRSLYELLPYIYLVIGTISGLLIDSNLILIASLLLIFAGILSIVTRYAYRRAHMQPDKIQFVEKRKLNDRRKRTVANFPCIDDFGNLIVADRRHQKRRRSFIGSFA